MTEPQERRDGRPETTDTDRREASGDPDDGSGEGSAPPDPTTAGGLSREEAVALRESFDRAERERIEETVADLLDLLGKAHAMAVLSEFAFAEDPLRFNELEGRLGVSPNTLSARLSELTDAGLLERRAYDEIPPRVEYEPTEKAAALFPAFAHLHHWAMGHDLDG